MDLLEFQQKQKELAKLKLELARLTKIQIRQAEELLATADPTNIHVAKYVMSSIGSTINELQ